MDHHSAGKHSFRSFHFSDETDIMYISCSSSDSLCSASELHTCDQNCVNIKIKESLSSNCGMHVWPSAPILGKYIWHNRSLLEGKIALELGAGTGLISTVTAKCGAHVIVTDSHYSVLNIASENLLMNNCDNFQVQKLTWGYFCPYLIAIDKVDVILGSDVFYDLHDFENIIVTISYIFKKNIHAEFWCAYEQRCSEYNIDHFIEKWGLVCEEVALKSFGAEGDNVADSDLPGLKKIHIFIFRSKLATTE